MSRENRFTTQMNQFFERASHLVQQGSQQMEAKPLVQFSPYSYEEHQVTIGDQKFQISRKVRRGGYDDHKHQWRTRDTLAVVFTPEVGDNLRFVRGAKPRLPVFEVYEEEGEYHGVLEFDLKHVERRHSWSRAWDHIEFVGGSSVQDFVDSARGANNILRSLNRRLEGNPTSFVPINPNLWNLVIGRHLGKDAPSLARS